MDFVQAEALDEAVEMLAARNDLVPLAGGTDVMVGINFGWHRPPGVLDISRIDALKEWTIESDGWVRLGATVPYTQIEQELSGELPALAMAARTVGSPPIRNRGTVGGNLGMASPAGDSHPPLLATRAIVEARSVRGTRQIPIDDFYVGPKRSSLAADELIVSVRIPVARGPQQFVKVGTRNAMVISVCAVSVAVDRDGGSVGVGIGSAGPTPIRARDAEALGSELVRRGCEPGYAELERFGALVAAAASPIDDVRGTARYRRHALGVTARRSLVWCLNEIAEW